MTETMPTMTDAIRLAKLKLTHNVMQQRQYVMFVETVNISQLLEKHVMTET